MDLVSTKVDPPVGLADLIDRSRLTERLADMERARLTVLQAPAGYGKTTLMLQWHQALKQQVRPAAWLSVESSDYDVVSFLRYIAAALATSHVQAGHEPREVAQGDPYATENSLMATLVNRLKCSETPIFLFFDDLHLLAGAPLGALQRLIELAPASAHFVVATRSTPDLHLARMRARGLLLEVRVDELRFNTSETRSFMTRATAQQFDSDAIQALEDRTEGWIAGIKLASFALRNGAKYEDMLASFTGSRDTVSDLFTEEVVYAQSEALREFLFKTSVLERMSPDLCDAVTGLGNARAMLKEIEDLSLFLVRLDGERTWYRYHHLFAQFLQRRLLDARPGADRELHGRASAWFWCQGLHVEAIEHALKGADPERAAELLELRCQDMLYTGKFALVRKFAQQIPAAVLHRYPRVLLQMAWLLTRNLQFEETTHLLRIVKDRLGEMTLARELPSDELADIRYLVLHREMTLSCAQDDALRTEAQCRRLLDEFPGERHPYLTATIHTQLLYARREQYQLGDLERLHSTAQGTLTRSGYNFATIALQASAGPSLFFAGHTDAACRALEQGLTEAIRFSGKNSAMAALPALPLSALVYERNDLDRAEQLLRDSLPFATEFGFVDQLLPGFLTNTRIRRARGDVPGAFAALDDATTIAVERGLERLRMALVGERVRLLIHERMPDQAARYARASGIPRSGDKVLPVGCVTTVDESVAATWVRVAHCEDRIAEALGVVQHWRSFCLARGAIFSLIQWNILMAQLLFVRGDLTAAQRALREAMGQAAPRHLIRCFVDEGPLLHSLLAAACGAERSVLHPTDEFAAELLAAFESAESKNTVRSAARAPAEGLCGKLSAKELEILVLVSSGMRNGEVGRKLGMTEGTVKWYMQQVYDKVGTRRRVEAVERARQFGLIA